MAEELRSFVDVEIRSSTAQAGSNQIIAALKKIEVGQIAVTKKIDGLEKSFSSFGKTSKESLSKIPNDVKALEEASNDAADSVDNLEKEMKDANKEFDKIVDHTNEAARGMDKLEKETKEAAGQMDKMGRQTQKADESISKGTTGLLGLAGAASKLPVGPLALFASAGVAIGSSVGSFKDFTQAMADLSAITGAVGEDLKFLEGEARDIGATTTLSATQAADAFRLMASAKPDLLENAEALNTVTRETLLLAQAAGVTLPEAAETVGSALNQYGKGAEEAARFVNVLAAGSKFGASEVIDTAEALKNSGVTASAASVGFETLNAAIQIMAQNAIKGGRAGTGLRNIILKLEQEGIKGAVPSVDGLANSLKVLGERSLATTELVEMFGLENVNTAQILIKNADALSEMEMKLTGTAVAQEQASIRSATLRGSLAGLGSTLEELTLILTSDTGFGGALAFVVDRISDLFSGIGFLIKAGVELTSSIKGFAKEYLLSFELVNDITVEFMESSRFLFTNLKDLSAIAAASVVKSMLLIGQGVESVFAAVVANVNKVRNAFLDMTIFISESVNKLGGVFQELTGIDFTISKEGIQTLKDMRAQTTDIGEAVEQVGKKYDKARKVVDDWQNSILDASEAQMQMTFTMGENENSVSSLNEELGKTSGILGNIGEDVQEYIDGLLEQADAMAKGERALAILNAQRQFSKEATEAELEAIAEVAGILFDQKEAIDAVREAKKQAIREQEEIAKMELKLEDQIAKERRKIAQQMEDDAVDVRDDLADIFVDFSENGRDAFDNILKNFQSFLAKMAAEAIANKIILSIGGPNLSGLSSASGSGSGGSLFGAALGGLGMLFGGGGAASAVSSGINDTALKASMGLAGGGGEFAGLFDSGGRIGSGQFGIVGEKRPELVKGPATVIGGDATNKMMNNGPTVGNVTINVSGQGDAQQAYTSGATAARAFSSYISSARKYG